MNKEYKLQFKVFLKLLWVCGFALLYAMGGIEHKWMRRFIAPVWLGGGMFLFSRDWRTLLQMPFLIVGLHFGYGAENIGLKLAKRAFVGIFLAGTTLTHLFDKNFAMRRFWGIFAWIILIIPITHIILGVINPVVARAEELLIAFMIGLGSMYIIKDKEQV